MASGPENIRIDGSKDLVRTRAGGEFTRVGSAADVIVANIRTSSFGVTLAHVDNRGHLQNYVTRLAGGSPSVRAFMHNGNLMIFGMFMAIKELVEAGLYIIDNGNPYIISKDGRRYPYPNFDVGNIYNIDGYVQYPSYTTVYVHWDETRGELIIYPNGSWEFNTYEADTYAFDWAQNELYVYDSNRSHTVKGIKGGDKFDLARLDHFYHANQQFKVKPISFRNGIALYMQKFHIVAFASSYVFSVHIEPTGQDIWTLTLESNEYAWAYLITDNIVLVHIIENRNHVCRFYNMTDGSEYVVFCAPARSIRCRHKKWKDGACKR